MIKRLIFPFFQIITGIVFVNVPAFVLRSIAQLILSTLVIDDVVKSLIIFLVRTVTVYFAYSLFVRIFEKRKAEEIAINTVSLKEFACGGLLGLFSITAVMTLMWISGSFSINGMDHSAPLLKNFFYHAFYALLQDIVYFAILFRIIEKHFGSPVAIIIASIVFGFKHLLFPGYTLWSVVAQTIEAGILFSALFILTRRIWMIVGFHLIWNYIEYGLILGFDAENLTPLFNSELTGTNLITGKPVGIEASLFTFCICTVVGIVMLIKAYKKGHFLLPNWKTVHE
ncbi:CPBP family intramembrane metalloprotease [bacterium]|nr:CPBP family intramembrane metalloprotease [bacterium]